MNYDLLIIKERNFTALVLFVIIIVLSIPLMLLSTLIIQSLIFHFIQYVLVIAVFSKQFQIHKIKSNIKATIVLLTLGLILFFSFNLNSCVLKTISFFNTKYKNTGITSENSVIPLVR